MRLVHDPTKFKCKHAKISGIQYEGLFGDSVPASGTIEDHLDSTYDAPTDDIEPGSAVLAIRQKQPKEQRWTSLLMFTSTLPPSDAHEEPREVAVLALQAAGLLRPALQALMRCNVDGQEAHGFGGGYCYDSSQLIVPFTCRLGTENLEADGGGRVFDCCTQYDLGVYLMRLGAVQWTVSAISKNRLKTEFAKGSMSGAVVREGERVLSTRQ